MYSIYVYIYIYIYIYLFISLFLFFISLRVGIYVSVYMYILPTIYSKDYELPIIYIIFNNLGGKKFLTITP